MKTQSILKTILLTVGFSAFTLTGGAQAQVLLTGGDASGGWVAPTDPVVAYDLGRTGYATGETIQGVTFAPWTQVSGYTAPSSPMGVTLTLNSTSGFAGYGSAPGVSVNGFGNSANDTAMADMLNGIVYNSDNGGTGPVSVTVTGLANGTYHLDAFIFYGNGTRNDMSLAIDGTTTNTFNALNQDGYVVQNTFTISGATPDLTFSVTDGDGQTSVLSGFDISSVPAEVPEPSTYALMGLGALALLVISRRRRTV